MENLTPAKTKRTPIPLDLVGKDVADKGKAKRKFSKEEHGKRPVKEEGKKMRLMDNKEKDSALTFTNDKDKEISHVAKLHKLQQDQVNPSVTEAMLGLCEVFGYRVLHAVPKEYGEMLGRGAFGDVYKYYDSESKTLMAVKMIHHRGSGSEMQTGRILMNEIDILKKLNHTRVVRYYKCEVRNMDVRIFIEYMPNGSVKDYMSKRQKPLRTEFAKKLTKQVLEGTAYLHKNNIVHRDIKASNVLLDAEKNAKLGDFGISKQVHILTNSNTCCCTHVGTPYWMSPERVRGEKYGKRADVWSVGCTLVEMFTMYPPWHEFETVAAIFKIGSGLHPTYQLPPNIAFVENFLSQTFCQQALGRPKANELLKHPFLIPITHSIVEKLISPCQVPVRVLRL